MRQLAKATAANRANPDDLDTYAALADVPQTRVAGAILITDGQVHDAPSPQALSLHAPLQVLVAGGRGERDRNFRLDAQDGRRFVLKFANPAEDASYRAMQIAAEICVYTNASLIFRRHAA